MLSHLHADHASLAGELVERTGCDVLRLEGPDTNIDRLREPTIERAERAALAREHGIPDDELEVMIDVPLADDGLQPRPLADALLRPGDTIAGGGRRRDRPLAEPARAVRRSPPDRRRRRLRRARALPRVGPHADPIAEYLATLDRLEALAPTRYLPGHGPPDDDPPGRLKAARQALAEMIEAVDAVGDGSAWEITSRVTGDDPDPEPKQTWIARVLCVLEHRRGQR